MTTTAHADPIYPFPTDPRPTSGCVTYDRLTLAMARARGISARATARHCADPSAMSLRIARAAVSMCMAAERRWVNHAFDSSGNYNVAPVLP